MKENFKALDGLRGLTAIYVFIHHARLALTQPYQNGLGLYPEKYNWYDKIMAYFFSFFKFGHEAVVIFFVLSGFVIHLKQSHSNYNFLKFNTILYFKKRIARIYPTLIVSFILCLFLDYLNCLLTNESFVNLYSKYHFKEFLFNFFLVPDSPIWGNNFPLWSLKHEWFFYVSYPFLLWLTQKNILFSLFVILSLYLSYVIGYKIPYLGSAAYTLLVWSLGCTLAWIYKNSNYIKVFPYLLLLIIIYPFINRSSDFFPLLDIIFGLIIMGFLSIILVNKLQFINKTLIKFAWLGTFSYSIYLLHTPFLNLYQSIILNKLPNQILPFHLWYVLASILITIPVIYIIYYFTERIAINYKKSI